LFLLVLVGIIKRLFSKQCRGFQLLELLDIQKYSLYGDQLIGSSVSTTKFVKGKFK